jgi:hypothetical protein
MSSKISTSLNIDDYEILIRKRGDNEYASYCPQINLMLTGLLHEEVENKMFERISRHIQELKLTIGQDPSKN